MADDEHPPIAHPGPLGIVESPCVEIVGGPASTFRSFPPPVAPPPHARTDRIGRRPRRHDVRIRLFAQDPPHSIASEGWRFVVGGEPLLAFSAFLGDTYLVDSSLGGDAFVALLCPGARAPRHHQAAVLPRLGGEFADRGFAGGSGQYREEQAAAGLGGVGAAGEECR